MIEAKREKEMTEGGLARNKGVKVREEKVERTEVLGSSLAGEEEQMLQWILCLP